MDIATPPIDQKRIEGRLFDLLSDALRFLDFHLMRRHRIRGLEPEVVLEFPVACLRETLVNAIAHRDYTIAGPIRLLVFDDRVEVRTPGGLPNSVRLDQLPAGVYVLRNPILLRSSGQSFSLAPPRTHPPYVLCGYAGHRHEAIFLTGIPESLPHASTGRQFGRRAARFRRARSPRPW